MSKIIIFIVIIATLAGASFWYFNRSASEAPAQTSLQTPAQETLTITIKDFSFSPKDISIKAGTTVKWTNEDSVGHTVTSQSNFDSGILSNGQSFSYTFNQPGIFDYTCTPHPFMLGKITVE